MSKKIEDTIETLAGRLDTSYLPVPVFIVWRDHTGKAQYAEKGEHPRSLIVSGYTQAVSVTVDDVIVAQFAVQDGGLMDQVAIAKKAIESLTLLAYKKEYVLDE
ncbi:hypothetical protein LCGC14_2113370 [marine sediment metagenome]|uniref:Uncharacterized protein n=1 Tax=marine sediment metagenome TaxID=412755 RepID=A0A0F9ETH5_9ZZZZ